MNHRFCKSNGYKLQKTHRCIYFHTIYVIFNGSYQFSINIITTHYVLLVIIDLTPIISLHYYPSQQWIFFRNEKTLSEYMVLWHGTTISNSRNGRRISRSDEEQKCLVLPERIMNINSVNYGFLSMTNGLLNVFVTYIGRAIDHKKFVYKEVFGVHWLFAKKCLYGFFIKGTE